MVVYSLTVNFSYVSTKWVVQENIYTPMEEINNPPPLWTSCTNLRHSSYDSPLPLWTGEISSVGGVWFFFWNNPINISLNSKYMTIIIQITNGQIGYFWKC